MQKITPFLWFDHEAEDAAKFYTGIFKNAKIESVSRYPKGSPYPAGRVMTVVFRIAGQRFIALNGGAEFQFNESISFVVNCDSQEEVDYFWQKLTADSGEESACGWLSDKFGLSWQVVPTVLIDMLHDEDSEKSERVTNAMLQMKKIDIKALKDAYAGK